MPDDTEREADDLGLTAEGVEALTSDDPDEDGAGDDAEIPEFVKALAESLNDKASVDDLVKKHSAAELAAMAMKGADYTRKTQTLAETVKANEAKDREIAELAAKLDERERGLTAKEQEILAENQDAFSWLAAQRAEGKDLNDLFDDGDTDIEGKDMDDDNRSSKELAALRKEVQDLRGETFEDKQRGRMTSILDRLNGVVPSAEADGELAVVRSGIETNIWNRFLMSGGGQGKVTIDDVARQVVSEHQTAQKHSLAMLAAAKRERDKRPRHEGSSSGMLETGDLPLDKVDMDDPNAWADAFVAEGMAQLAAHEDE